MERDSHLAAYVNKTISSKFMGRQIVFRLSHGLFSSFAVDAGTRLLLKTIAQKLDLSRAKSAVDIGCGVGVIGVSVSAAAPHLSVVLQDRDALAAAFARSNAEANRCAGVSTDCGLAFQHLEDRRFDLVVSNLPAKAGKPVLADFFGRIFAHLAEGGVAAVVVIDAIADFALSTVQSLGYGILYHEKNGGYNVLHFRPGAGGGRDALDDPLACYIRAEAGFSSHDVSYSLQTAYNLPDFDTLGHLLELAFDVLHGQKTSGRILFWNPGQGHLPAYLLSLRGKSISEIILAGRDSLEIAISRRNIEKLGFTVSGTAAVACEPFLGTAAAGGSVDFLCAVPHPVPGALWQKDLADAARALLRVGGSLFVVGKSTEIHRLEPCIKGFAVRVDKRQMGHRALLLDKR